VESEKVKSEEIKQKPKLVGEENSEETVSSTELENGNE
jgi:hypothetical protein